MTVLIAGVGGQGIVLVGGVLAQAAMLSGFDVLQSEMHGLSQRFGSVSCQIRIGTGLYSTHRGHGSVDLLLALECYEAFKQLPFLRSDDTALVNRLWRKPTVKPHTTEYLMNINDPRMEWFDGTELTLRAGCPRSVNFFMLGVLSTWLEISEPYWHEAIETSSSKGGREANREMFATGRQTAAQSVECEVRRQSFGKHRLARSMTNEIKSSAIGN